MRVARSKSTASDSPRDPYPIALRLLTGRDYTVAAMTRKLLVRGCCADDVRLVVERLQQERFLDDRRYAERFVESSLSSGRYVGYRLRQELKRRGLSAELIDSVMPVNQKDTDEHDLVRALIARRYASFDPVTADDRERRRVAGFLQRRGFGPAIIRSILFNQVREVDNDW